VKEFDIQQYHIVVVEVEVDDFFFKYGVCLDEKYWVSKAVPSWMKKGVAPWRV
jgi:hypothetical protein